VADTEYYVQGIQRALALLQMGLSSKAQVILRDTLAKRLKTHPSEALDSTMPQLLNKDVEIPKCWFDQESQTFIIDDRGWKIDPKFSAYLRESVKVWKDPILKLNAEKIEQRAQNRIKKGLLEGFMQKK